MEIYSPFEVDIAELQADNLAVLKNTPEGWYIEYKQAFANSSTAAKSISAYANTYGGWLFYGIKESDQRTAGEFIGVSLEEIPIIEQKIRSGISDSVSPTPFFSTKIVYGPNPAIGLPEDKAIIVVHVPMGNNAPYVHNSGRIYRRVAESSDPVAETDRHFLDLLWQRGQQTKDRFSDFIKEPLELSEGESGATYIKIYFFLDPWLQKYATKHLSFEEFATLMASAETDSGGIPFDNNFAMNKGYVARQAAGNIYNNLVFTWKYYHRGISEISLPINTLSFNDLHELYTHLDGYDHKNEYIKICQDIKIKFGRILDLSQLYINLNSIVKRNRVLFESAGITDPVYAKIMIDEVWRKIPFFDLSETNDFFSRYGLPVIQDKQYFFPPGIGPESCLYLKPSYDITTGQQIDDHNLDYIHAYFLFIGIAQILGVPANTMLLGDNGTNKLLAMGRRAGPATRARTDRLKS